MQFAFLIMGNFDVTVDRACIHDGMAQIIGVSSLTEACDVAKYLYEEGIGCIELCGAFGEQGAKVVRRRTMRFQSGMSPICRNRMNYIS